MFGEIFICQFPFTSGAFSKPRPVLVLFDCGVDVVICRLTSVPHTGVADVSLQDWTQAGLLKPSVARLDKLVTAEKAILGRRMGSLTATDTAAIRTAWNQHMKL